MSNTDLSRAELTEQVIELVTNIVAEESGETPEITPKTSLMSELDIDSLTIVRLDVVIQSKLGLALSADHLEEIDTVDDLVTALIEHGQPADDLD